jgi:hypothetical protein
MGHVEVAESEEEDMDVSSASEQQRRPCLTLHVCSMVLLLTRPRYRLHARSVAPEEGGGEPSLAGLCQFCGRLFVMICCDQ